MSALDLLIKHRSCAKADRGPGAFAREIVLRTTVWDHVGWPDLRKAAAITGLPHARDAKRIQTMHCHP